MDSSDDDVPTPTSQDLLESGTLLTVCQESEDLPDHTSTYAPVGYGGSQQRADAERLVISETGKATVGYSMPGADTAVSVRQNEGNSSDSSGSGSVAPSDRRKKSKHRQTQSRGVLQRASPAPAPSAGGSNERSVASEGRRKLLAPTVPVDHPVSPSHGQKRSSGMAGEPLPHCHERHHGRHHSSRYHANDTGMHSANHGGRSHRDTHPKDYIEHRPHEGKQGSATYSDVAPQISTLASSTSPSTHIVSSTETASLPIALLSATTAHMLPNPSHESGESPKSLPEAYGTHHKPPSGTPGSQVAPSSGLGVHSSLFNPTKIHRKRHSKELPYGVKKPCSPDSTGSGGVDSDKVSSSDAEDAPAPRMGDIQGHQSHSQQLQQSMAGFVYDPSMPIPVEWQMLSYQNHQRKKTGSDVKGGSEGMPMLPGQRPPSAPGSGSKDQAHHHHRHHTQRSHAGRDSGRHQVKQEMVDPMAHQNKHHSSSSLHSHASLHTPSATMLTPEQQTRIWSHPSLMQSSNKRAEQRPPTSPSPAVIRHLATIMGSSLAAALQAQGVHEAKETGQGEIKLMDRPESSSIHRPPGRPRVRPPSRYHANDTGMRSASHGRRSHRDTHPKDYIEHRPHEGKQGSATYSDVAPQISTLASSTSPSTHIVSSTETASLPIALLSATTAHMLPNPSHESGESPKSLPEAYGTHPKPPSGTPGSQVAPSSGLGVHSSLFNPTKIHRKRHSKELPYGVKKPCSPDSTGSGGVDSDRVSSSDAEDAPAPRMRDMQGHQSLSQQLQQSMAGFVYDPSMPIPVEWQMLSYQNDQRKKTGSDVKGGSEGMPMLPGQRPPSAPGGGSKYQAHHHHRHHTQRSHAGGNSGRQKHVQAAVQQQAQMQLIKAYKESLDKHGSVSVEVTQCIFIGPSATGKSTLKHLLVHNTPKAVKTSTAIIDTPEVVSVSSEQYAVHGGCSAWQLVDDETMAKSLCDCITSKTYNEGRKSPQKRVSHIPTSSSNEIATLLLCNPGSEERRGSIKLKDAAFINLLDTGGQPSFQDALPLLLDAPCTFIQVFNAARDLDQPVPITYRPDDHTEKSLPPSEETGWEMMLHSFSSMYTMSHKCSKELASFQLKGSLLPHFRIYVVGTFKDQLVEEGRHKKTAEDISKCLRELEGKPYYRFMKKDPSGQPFYLISSMTVKDDESTYLNSFREALSNSHSAFKLDVPLTWYICKQYTQRHPQKFFRFQDLKAVCLEHKFIDENGADEQFRSLLKLFSLFGFYVFFNLKDVPDEANYVCTNKGVFLKEVSKLLAVQFLEAPRCHSVEVFKQNGIISNNAEMFEELGIIKEVDQSWFFAALEHVGLLARYSSTSDCSPSYFMPVALPQGKTKLPEHSSIASLCVTFTFVSPDKNPLVNTDLPRGVFCRLAVELSNGPWTPIPKASDRATVKFHADGFELYLTEVPGFIRLTPVLVEELERKEPLAELYQLCREMYNTLHRSIVLSAKDVLGEQFSQTAKIVCGFECGCGRVPHLATPASEKARSLICQTTKNRRRILNREQIWFIPVESAKLVPLGEGNMWVMEETGDPSSDLPQAVHLRKRVHAPQSTACSLERNAKSLRTTAAPLPVSKFLEKYESEFFEVVDPKVSLHKLTRKGVITKDVKSNIETSNIDDAREILYDHLICHANVDTLRTYCEVAMDASGLPKLQALGRKMMEELPQGGN